jgi:hypothetical protein
MLIIWIVLAFLGCILALLAVPVDLTFSMRRHDGEQESSGRLCWLFGLIRLRLDNNPSGPRPRPKQPKRNTHRRGKSRNTRYVVNFLNEGLGGRMLRLSLDLLRRIRVYNLSLEARMGLDDPADTGRLWGMVGPAAAILAQLPVVHVAIEPDFSAQTFQLDGQGHIRIVPLEMLWVILVFVLTPATLRALYSMRATA